MKVLREVNIYTIWTWMFLNMVNIVIIFRMRK